MRRSARRPFCFTKLSPTVCVNVTDHKCGGILSESGPITAGELAARTGLTTGAITGVIDRLEKAGLRGVCATPRIDGA